MATGGIFQLITNDGKQDRMLMATALLNKRLLEIERMRAQNPQIKDPTPTLVDIERTHVLFMNAHFKPFAAIGYEYNKVAVQSGQARLNSTIQFSIPQFGDFFNDMVFHVILDSVEAANATYWTGGTTAANGTELLAYVDNPGQALCLDTQFTVNGNPLDDYTSDILNFHNKFFVTPHKRIGWDRNVGMEVPWKGWQQVTDANGNAGRGAGVRLQEAVLNGPQTPQVTQPALEMWIPLLFWFNMDPRLSIPSVSIPYGQRFINIQLAPANQLLQQLHAYNPALDSPGTNTVPVPDVTTAELWINNIFVNPEIHDIFIKRIGFSLIRVHRYQTIRTSNANDNLLLNNLKWPIETIYFGLRPTANIDTTSTSLLTNWDMYALMTPYTLASNSNQDYVPLRIPIIVASPQLVSSIDTALQGNDGFIWTAQGRKLNTIENIVPGVTGGSTVTLAILQQYFGFYGLATVSASAHAWATPVTGAQLNQWWPMAPNAALTAANALGSGGSSNSITYNTCSPTLSTVSVVAHGIPLYNALPQGFFNTYTPFIYGGTHVQTPYDCGAYMIPFNLYPGAYQPSGHVNVSRAREFYLQYTGSVVGTSAAPMADLVVVAIAINFLLISDGSAVLRYST
jgi:hypothetical protein